MIPFKRFYTSLTELGGRYLPIETLNKVSSYVLLVLVFGPHGAQECIPSGCTGPYFVNPMIFTFIAPNWAVDMSFHAWFMQFLFGLPLVVVLYVLFKISQNQYGVLFKLYLIRWAVMWFVIVWYYNFIFWSYPVRGYVFPLFIS